MDEPSGPFSLIYFLVCCPAAAMKFLRPLSNKPSDQVSAEAIRAASTFASANDGQSTTSAPDAGRQCCYVGIDLGTSGTGCTYALDSNPFNIKVLGRLPGEDALAAKTATALLYEVNSDGTWECIEWGTRAMQRYRVSNAADQAKWRLLEGKQFKLALAGYENLKASGFPKSYAVPQDCPLSPKELITEVLSKLHKHLVWYIGQQEKVDLMSPDIDVHYCLSVPAGWSPAAKNIMRQAAEAAGFKRPVSTTAAADSALPSPSSEDSSIHRDNSSISSSSSNNRMLRILRSASTETSSTSNSNNHNNSNRPTSPRSISSSSGANMWLDASAISIIHEQEAAALSACCDPYGSWEGLRARPGDVWVVVDAGGGTVDIAMHTVTAGTQEDEAQLSELLGSVCLPCGSTLLDVTAEGLLLKPMFASNEAYTRWKSSHPRDFARQMKKWEDCKQEFDGDNEPTLGFVESFLEAMPAASPYRSQMVRHLDAPMLRRVFDPIVTHQIVSHVRTMVSQQRRSDGRSGADVVLLCGGFACNDYLKSQLERECRDYVGKVLRPTEPLQSVVLGNTIHLQRPKSIKARCSRVTYGLRCCHHAEESCRAFRQDHIMQTPSRDSICTAYFKPLVHAGDIVQLDERTAPWSTAPMPGHDAVKLEVYATDMETAVHVTEDHMMRVGEVEFRVRDKGSKWLNTMFGNRKKTEDCSLNISFLFGAAEIIVEARQVGSKRAVNTAINFANDPAQMAVALPVEPALPGLAA